MTQPLPENPTRPAPKLRVFSVEDLVKANELQRRQYDWDFSKEREFMENMLCQRVNFLLVAYSLFVTAAASTESQQILTAVCFGGSLMAFFVSLTIYRAYLKLMVNLSMLYRFERHPLSMIDQETIKARGGRLFRANPILGIVIPALCTLSLLLAGVLAKMGVLSVR